MADLLDHPLLEKYFGCSNFDCGSFSYKCMAKRVLEAMWQPIRNGERYLFYADGAWIENDSGEYYGFHPKELRLPDRFQIQTKPDPVEEKIIEISRRWSVPPYKAMAEEMRELVKLAKEAK